MKIANKEKNVTQVGEIKNNAVSIDTSNIDFIVTILSTNLYSKPIESFIRETVSNAWDSHVEAGVDDPVILELGKDTEGNKFCRIQDFGVGLSPERFNSVYKNIGSSTKRDSNEQIGGFGIGRFSALAYADVVHITSVHNGRKYLYMMYKDGNSVSIDMLHEQDTDERNGLEVKLEIKSWDYDNFAKAIKSQLVYFENLYIIDSIIREDTDDILSKVSVEKDYNNFSIKKYKNFWVNSLDDTKEINLVLGKVRYPVRIYNLDKPYANKVSKYPISLKFDIGDLEVTPNREEIMYSATNKKVIEDKLDLAILEIDELIMQEKTQDFDKISKYLAAIDNTQYLTLLESGEKEVKLKLSDTKRNLTLFGMSYDAKNFKSTFNQMMSSSEVISQYTYRNSQIKYNNVSLSVNKIKDNFDDIYLADLGDASNIAKRYIRETFNHDSYFIKNDRPLNYYIKKYMDMLKDHEVYTNRMGAQGYTAEKFFYDHQAFKVICRFIINNITKLQTFNNSKVPQSWIATTKAADKVKRGNIKKQGFDWKQNINVHELRFKDYGGGVMTDSKSYAMKDLSKKFKALCIYDTKNSLKLRALWMYLKNSRNMPRVIEVAPTKIKLLKNVENFVKIEDFMSTDYKLLRNIATVEFLKREMPFLKEVAKISNIEKVSERLAVVIEELRDFVDKYESASSRHANSGEEQTLIDEIYSIAEEKGYFNEEIKGLFTKHKEELMNSIIFVDFIKKENGYISNGDRLPENRINLIVDYVLARKLIRPSVKAVVKLKTETIFNLKPEENEDN